ncbi:hypothetical protein P691DRAFT_735517 [Macrolepiota fuliginosa MF-IS2]|uniref:WD40 repeat-like protein n=1 Tax=Macrolepiota fuliginosa MF-IS2 TaxID=1400762 RepID=A0A9P5X6R1_9AGAR|nr:hypothetical protein P691DRAFT_735517 [Macrolepiota fuliginosa MF-IS2]
MTEQQPTSAGGLPTAVALESPRSFDYSYTHDDGIKESFVRFSGKTNDLDKQLGKFANDCLKLGRVAGLLLAIKSAREMLRRTREAFFRNAIALHSELFELARKDCTTKSRDLNAEHYFIPPQYFRDPPPPFDVLPTVLEELAQSFSLLHVRIDEFREFTDEGLLLKSLLLTLERDLMYRASCVRVYSGRLNTPPIQRYVHQFTDELETDFEKMATAFEEFTAVGVSAISHEQQRSSQNLTNILTVATFFSGVTAATLSMSVGTHSQNGTLRVASMLWFTSLVFSVGAALNSLLAMAWKETRSGSRGGKLPLWVTMWIDGSQLLFLGISIVTFSAGLVVYAYSSDQASYTPHVTVAATVVTFCGLIAILIWMIYEICVSPVLRQQADVIKSSGESVHSDVSKISFLSANGISGALSNALFSLGLPKHGNANEDDIEKVEEGGVTVEELPKQEESPPGRLKAKLQENVKNISILGTAMSAFISAGHQYKHNLKAPTSPKNRLRIDTNISSIPVTQLNLPLQPVMTIELARYGTIHDIAYSEDGKQLAVTCAKEMTGQSWTVVYDTESMETVADTWHEGRVVSERLVWSPSGTKLIVKFEHRFDVWDLVAKDLRVVERHHHIKDVKWCGDDAFLVAEHSCVFKMNLTRLMAAYRFEHMHVRSVSLERKNNYLIVITRVSKSPEEFEPASGRSEKRIVIYDMDKQEAVYQVPVLEDIRNIHPITGELDILVTHKDQKAFQMWSLDAGVKGAEITTRLKKRNITPHVNPGDYVGPTSVGGNYNQFIFSATSTGAIDIWRRESGTPHQRFEPQILQDEGVRCFSWRRSSGSTAIFATAGIDSHLLHIWSGEEPVLARTPVALDPVRSFGSKTATNRTRWLHAAQLATEPSSDSSSSRGVDGNSAEGASGT